MAEGQWITPQHSGFVGVTIKILHYTSKLSSWEHTVASVTEHNFTDNNILSYIAAEHITKDVCFPHNPAGLATAGIYIQ